MKNTHKLFGFLLNLTKESRLVWGDTPSAKPTAEAEASKDDESVKTEKTPAELAAELQATQEKFKASTKGLISDEIGDNDVRGKFDDLSAKQGEIDKLLKGGIVEDEAAKAAEFNKDMTDVMEKLNAQAKADIEKGLKERKESLANLADVKAEQATFMLDKLGAAKGDIYEAAKAAIVEGLTGVEEEYTAKLEEIGTIAVGDPPDYKNIKEALDVVPVSLKTLLDSRSFDLYPKTQDLVYKQMEYAQAISYVTQEDKEKGIFDVSKGKESEKYVGELKKIIEGWSTTLPDQAKVTETLQKYEGQITLARVVDVIRGKDLDSDQKDLLSKILKVKDPTKLTVEQIEAFFAKNLKHFESGSHKLDEKAQKLSAFLMKFAEEADVQAVLEGGADGEAYKRLNPGRLDPLVELAKTIASDADHHPLRKTPQVARALDGIKELAGMANGAGAKAAIEGLKTSDPTKYEDFTKAGGILNIVLAAKRTLVMAGGGNIDKNVALAVNASSTGGKDKDKRYARLSFGMPASNLNVTTTVQPTIKAPAVVAKLAADDEAQKAAEKLTASKEAITKEVPALFAKATKALETTEKTAAVIAAKTEVSTKVEALQTALDLYWGGGLDVDEINALDQEKIDELTGKIKDHKEALEAAVTKLEAATGVAEGLPSKLDTTESAAAAAGLKVEVDKDTGEYTIEGEEGTFAAEEVDYLSGKEIMSEDFMKGKVSLSFVKEGTTLPVEFDRSSGKITGVYKVDGSNNVTVTYNLKTGKKTITPVFADLTKVKDLLKDTSKETLAAAKKAGLDVSTVDIDAGQGDIEDLLKAKNYADALEKVAAEDPVNVSEAALCLSLITLADLQRKVRGLDKLTPNLVAIIGELPATISDAMYSKLAVLGEISGDALTAVLTHDLEVGIAKKLMKITDNQTNASLVEKYLGATAEFDAAEKNVSIAAIKLNAGKTDYCPEAVDFVVANYDEIGEAAAKPIVVELLKNPATPGTKFEKAYEKVFGVDGFSDDPALWGRYNVGKGKVDLLGTGLENKFAAGKESEMTPYLEQLALRATTPTTTIGSIDTADPNALPFAKRILLAMKKSGNPVLRTYIGELETKIKALDPDFEMTKPEDTAKELYDVAKNTDAKAADRLAAITELLDAKYDAVTLVAGQSREAFKKALTSLQSGIAWKEGDYDKVDGGALDAEGKEIFTPAQKKFMELWKGSAPQESDLVFLSENVKDLTPERVLKLVDSKFSGFKQVDAYIKLGMKGLANEKIASLPDAATKGYCEMLLEGKLGDHESVKAAYQAIDTANTPLEVQVKLIKAVKVLSETLSDPSLAVEFKEMIDDPVNPLGGHAKAIAALDYKTASYSHDEKGAIIMARLIIAEMEQGECKAGQVSCDASELVYETKNYLDTQPKMNPEFVEQVMKQVESASFGSLDADAQKAYTKMMLRAAKEDSANQDKYFEGLDVGNFTSDPDKVTFLKAVGRSQEAAAFETDTTAKMDLLKQAVADAAGDQAKLIEAAEAYNTIDTPEANEEAAKIFLDTDQFGKAFAILIDTNSATKVRESFVESLDLIKLFHGRMSKVIDIAKAHNFHDVELEVFKSDPAQKINIERLTAGTTATGNHKMEKADVITVLTSGREGKVVGSVKDRVKFYWENNDKDNWTDAGNENFMKNLDVETAYAEAVTAKEDYEAQVVALEAAESKVSGKETEIMDQTNVVSDAQDFVHGAQGILDARVGDLIGEGKLDPDGQPFDQAGQDELDSARVDSEIDIATKQLADEKAYLGELKNQLAPLEAARDTEKAEAERLKTVAIDKGAIL